MQTLIITKDEDVSIDVMLNHVKALFESYRENKDDYKFFTKVENNKIGKNYLSTLKISSKGTEEKLIITINQDTNE